MKTCSTCRIEKQFSEFHKRKQASDGFQSTCKSCRKIIDSDSYLKYGDRRQAIKDRRDFIRDKHNKLVRRYKRYCGCTLCGEREPVALDLHHTDPTVKEDNPANMLGGSTKRLLAEIRKCVVLCSNCHRKVHAGILKLPL